MCDLDATNAVHIRRLAWIAWRRTATLLALLATVTSASAAQSARPDTVHTKGSKQVRETPPRGDSVRRLAPLEIRTSIVPSARLIVGSGAPAHVASVSGGELASWRPRILADALAKQPGFSLYDDLGAPRKMNLTTRGFAVGPTVGQPAGVTVFVDGIRQNEPDAQEVNFDLLPLRQVARIEVLSGNASLLGPNSLGGAVNLVTQRGEGATSGSVSVTAGSFERASIDGSVGGRSRSGFDYLAGGGFERDGGWRAATGARNYNVLINVGRVGDERGVTLQGYAARSRAETAGSLPESLFDASPRANFTPGDFDDLNAQQLAFSAFAPALGGRTSLGVHLRRSIAERFNVNQAPDPNVRSRTSNLSIGATADWRTTFRSLGAGELSLRIGGDARLDRVHARIYTETAAGESSFGESARELSTDVESPGGDVAGYALADYRIRRLTLSGGGRYDLVHVPFRNRLRVSDDTQNNYRAVSPRLGLSFVFAPGVSLYASAGRSFRAPAILELGCADPAATCPLPFALGDDPPLRAVRSTTFEIGGEWARASWLASVTAYRSAVRNEIFFVASETALFSGYFTNLDKTRREGVEGSLQGGVGERLTWFANYAWTRATFQSESELFSVRSDARGETSLGGANIVRRGSRLPLVPSHQVKAGVQGVVVRGALLGIDARLIGKQWMRGDEANETSPMASYSVVNALASYRRGAWGISAVVTNLMNDRRAVFGTFNVNRATSAVERFFTPMNARELRVTVQRSFGRSRQVAQDIDG